jgi:hypothetical protein
MHSLNIVTSTDILTTWPRLPIPSLPKPFHRAHGPPSFLLRSLAAMSRPNVSRTGTDYSGIPSESEVSDGVADEDREEDITIVVHSK